MNVHCLCNEINLCNKTAPYSVLVFADIEIKKNNAVLFQDLDITKPKHEGVNIQPRYVSNTHANATLQAATSISV